MDSSAAEKPVIGNMLEVLMGLCLAAMVVIISGAAIGRYLFGVVPPWCEEASRCLFIYQIFLGAALATFRREHLRVDFVASLLPPRIRRALDLLMCSLSILFLIFVVSYSVPLLRKVYVFPMPAMRFSTSYIYLAVPLGSALMLIFMSRQLLRELRARRNS